MNKTTQARRIRTTVIVPYAATEDSMEEYP